MSDIRLHMTPKKSQPKFRMLILQILPSKDNPIQHKLAQIILLVFLICGELSKKNSKINGMNIKRFNGEFLILQLIIKILGKANHSIFILIVYRVFRGGQPVLARRCYHWQKDR